MYLYTLKRYNTDFKVFKKDMEKVRRQDHSYNLAMTSPLFTGNRVLLNYSSYEINNLFEMFFRV